MPYKLKQSGSGWKVCKKTGTKCFSKEPIPKSRAKAQMRALHANVKETFETAIERLLKEFTSTDNPVGATTTTAHTPAVTNGSIPSSNQFNPKDPASVSASIVGKDANNSQHVQSVIDLYKNHPQDWNAIKTQYKTTDDKAAAQQLIKNNPPVKSPAPQATPLNKPQNTGASVVAAAPSTNPSISFAV